MEICGEVEVDRALQRAILRALLARGAWRRRIYGALFVVLGVLGIWTARAGPSRMDFFLLIVGAFVLGLEWLPLLLSRSQTRATSPKVRYYWLTENDLTVATEDVRTTYRLTVFRELSDTAAVWVLRGDRRPVVAIPKRAFDDEQQERIYHLFADLGLLADG